MDKIELNRLLENMQKLLERYQFFLKEVCQEAYACDRSAECLIGYGNERDRRFCSDMGGVTAPEDILIVACAGGAHADRHVLSFFGLPGQGFLEKTALSVVRDREFRMFVL